MTFPQINFSLSSVACKLPCEVCKNRCDFDLMAKLGEAWIKASVNITHCFAIQNSFENLNAKKTPQKLYIDPSPVLEKIFSLFTGHNIMSFQIILSVQHFTNLTGQNSLTDNILKKITQDVWARCSVIMCNHNVQLARHFQNLVRLCLMKTCYFQHYISVLSHESQWLLWNQTNKVLHQYKWEATYFLFNHFNYHYTK